jgi:predicted Zn finger-like uncharacterized protein
MKVHCEKCKAEYNLDEGRIGPEGLQIRCPRCKATFVVTNEAVGGGEMFDYNSVDQKAIGADAAANERPLELDRAPIKIPRDVPTLPSQPTTQAPSGLDLVTESSPKTAVSSSVSSLPSLSRPALPPLPGSDTVMDVPSGNEGQIFDFQSREIAGAETSTEAMVTETAPPNAANLQRYRIRRKSGKVFGPFDGETINRMLIEHQLMGDEEASIDGNTYKPLGVFPEFAASFQEVMDEPVISPPLPRSTAATAKRPDEKKDELRTVARDMPPAKEHKGITLPSRFMLIALGGLGLVVIAGLGLGLTRYGFFGSRFLSGEVGGDEPVSGQVDQNTTKVAVQTKTEPQVPKITPPQVNPIIEKPSKTFTADLFMAVAQNVLGEAHYAQKDFSLAEAEFLEALNNDPVLTPAYFNLANTYRELGRYDEAVANYQKVVALAPKHPNLAREYGYARYLRKDYAEALKLYLEAVRLSPKDDRLHLQTGIVSLENGDAQTAAKHFQTAIEINSANVDAHMQLGLLSYKNGDLDQAQESLKRAIGIDKENPNIHYALAQTLLAAKQFMDAMEELRIVVKLKPDHLEAVQGLNKLLIERGQYEEAVKHLNQAIAAQPKQVELLLLLGDVFQNQSLLPQALKTYQKALTIDPKATGLALRLARAYDDLNQKATAIKFYLETVKQEPTNAIPHYYLGHIYKANNNKRLALAEFRRYLQLRPDAPDAADVNDEIAYLQNE